MRSVLSIFSLVPIWLMGWFYSITTPVGLIYAEVILTFMVSNWEIQQKYIFTVIFKQVNISFSSANALQKITTSNRFIWLIDGVLTGITTEVQSGPRSNDDDEKVALHPPELQKCSFNTGGNLVLCPQHSA